jgi:hypothetical protein
MKTSDAPEAVIQAVIAASAARRWPDVLAFVDRSELPRWRRVTLSMLRHYEQQPNAGQLMAEWGAQHASELEPLADEELFARWMQAFTLEARMRVSLGTSDTVPPIVERVVLGSVREGDDRAHVVYREIVGTGTALRIATLRLTSDGWRVGVDYDLLGTASLHFAPQSQPPPADGAG